MTFSGALVLKGNLSIGPALISVADVSDQVTGFTISAARDTVDVPPTLATSKSTRAGGVAYSIKIDYLSSDHDAAGDLFRIFWASLATAEGKLWFTGSTLDGAISATNPQWQGEFIVIGAALGGAAEGLSTDSQTFPMTGPPVIDITP